MLSLHAQVECAVRNAPLVDPNRCSFNDLDALNSMTDSPDDALIRENPNAKKLPHAVYVDAGDDERYREAFAAYADVLNRTIPTASVDRIIRHEGQHHAASLRLGAQRAWYGIEITRVPDDLTGTEIYHFQPFHSSIDFVVTKLGAALISGYPIDPSSGDMQSIYSLGYSGINEIAERAMAFNSRCGNPQRDGYPIPLCYSSVDPFEADASLMYQREMFPSSTLQPVTP